MNKEIEQVTVEPLTTPDTRPVLLTVWCLAAFVFFGIFTILHFFGILYNNWIIEVTNQYIPEELNTKTEVRFLFLAGFILHATALAGAVLMWRLRRLGYYLLSVSCLIVSFYQLFQSNFTVASTFLYIFMIIGFGLFYRRFH